MNRLDTIRRQLNLQQYVVYLGFLAIFLFFAVTLADDGFLTTRNLTNIVLQTAPATIMAIGFVFVLSAGEIDLSFGSITAVSALSAAVVMQDMPMLAGVGCRARRRPFDRLLQRRAGGLSEASVLSRHPGDARPLCRFGTIDDGSALHSRDQ